MSDYAVEEESGRASVLAWVRGPGNAYAKALRCWCALVCVCVSYPRAGLQVNTSAHDAVERGEHAFNDSCWLAAAAN